MSVLLLLIDQDVLLIYHHISMLLLIDYNVLINQSIRDMEIHIPMLLKWKTSILQIGKSVKSVTIII